MKSQWQQIILHCNGAFACLPCRKSNGAIRALRLSEALAIGGNLVCSKTRPWDVVGFAWWIEKNAERRQFHWQRTGEITL